jgi:hypothetical protein
MTHPPGKTPPICRVSAHHGHGYRAEAGLLMCTTQGRCSYHKPQPQQQQKKRTFDVLQSQEWSGAAFARGLAFCAIRQ